MTRTTYVLNGDVTAVGPLATCGPAASRAAGSGPKPIPTVRTVRGEVMYMPAMGFRSKLRGACTALVCESLKQSGRPMLSLQDAQLLRLGGIKQGGAEAPISYDDYQSMLTANPLLAVFGSSTPWVDGKLMVGHMYCQEAIDDGQIKSMVVDGVRSNMLRREPGLVDFLNESALQEHAEHRLAVRRSVEAKARLMALDREWRKEPDKEKRHALKTAHDAAKIEFKKDIVVPEGLPLAGYAAIPAGSVMEQRLRLLNATTIEFGCLLASLERFALEPLIGAHLAHGCGEIEGVWSVSVRAKAIGKIRMVPWVGLEFEGDETMQEALNAYKHFLLSPGSKPWAPEFLKTLVSEVAGDE